MRAGSSLNGQSRRAGLTFVHSLLLPSCLALLVCSSDSILPYSALYLTADWPGSLNFTLNLALIDVLAFDSYEKLVNAAVH